MKHIVENNLRPPMLLQCPQQLSEDKRVKSDEINALMGHTFWDASSSLKEIGLNGLPTRAVGILPSEWRRRPNSLVQKSSNLHSVLGKMSSDFIKNIYLLY